MRSSTNRRPVARACSSKGAPRSPKVTKNLIERLPPEEDIDITVFRGDIGQPATVEELEALSGKKRNDRLEAIKAACQEYIHGPMLEQLSTLLRQTLQTAKSKSGSGRAG